ncbi:MAG TPA: hypothetical protein VNB90_17280 [Cytophagaceae bacterium]|nr:hypothetical protein [Cytophagaceae bacterium]
MKYDLQPLDELIGNDGDCDEEVQNIIDQIKETAYRLSSKEEIRLYIRHHQTALLKKKCNEAVCSNCDSILFFLESYFSDFVDADMEVSQSGRNEIFEQCLELRIVVAPLLFGSLNLELTDILLVVLTPESRNHLTIHDTKYISTFWESWANYFSYFKKSFQEQEVIDYLIAHNFNSHPFFNYLINKITGELSQFDENEAQIQLLEDKLLHYKKIPESSIQPFAPKISTANKLLVSWLKEEIKKCRKRLKTHNPSQLSILPKSKIETSLSVAQLAYLTRVMYDNGILTNNSQSEILQVIAKMMKCKKTDQISLGSLSNKYYDVEDNTKVTVRELLKEVLKKLQ